MKLISVQALRGPNIHSFNPYKLIHLRLDFSEQLEMTEHEVKQLEHTINENLILPASDQMTLIFEDQSQIPSPTLDQLAIFAGRIALQLQIEAGCSVKFLKILKTIYFGIYGVLFEYDQEDIGKYAAKSTAEILDQLLNKKSFNPTGAIEKIKQLKTLDEQDESLNLVLKEIKHRNIPVIPLFGKELLQLGYGKFQKRLNRSLSEQTNAISYLIASNRSWLTDILYEHSIPYIKNPENIDSYPSSFGILVLNHRVQKSIHYLHGIIDQNYKDDLNENTCLRLERWCLLLGLIHGEIQIVSDGINNPDAELLQINANPQFHLYQNSVARKNPFISTFVDSLFPKSEKSRIPIIAVSGTNGKTTTTRLISHIIQQSGIQTGFTTSDGVYVGGRMVEKGDTTGPGSALIVLRDPTVDFAILETARGGILRAGLAFTECDAAVLTNITSDHLGLSDVHTLDDLSKAKGLIVDAVKTNGYAILNLENEYTYQIGQKAKCQVAYFSLDPNYENLKTHIQQGGTAAFVENGFIKIFHQNTTTTLIKTEDIPLTFGGKVPFMIANALAASLTCFTQGFTVEQIANGLKSFFPSVEQTPGRLNIYDFPNFKVMVDFAHNPEGFSGIRDFLSSIDSPNKIGIITGTGDRPDESIIQLGELSAEMFDHIIIHQAKFLRGRTSDAIVDLLIQGIQNFNPSGSYEYISDDTEPLQYAIKLAKKDSFITALSDVLNNPIELIKQYQESYFVSK